LILPANSSGSIPFVYKITLLPTNLILEYNVTGPVNVSINALLLSNLLSHLSTVNANTTYPPGFQFYTGNTFLADLLFNETTVGFNVYINDSTSIVSLQLNSPFSLLGSLNFRYGFVYWDINTKRYIWFPGNATATNIVASIPLTGFYIFIYFDVTRHVKLPALFTFPCTAGSDNNTYTFELGFEVQAYSATQREPFYVSRPLKNPFNYEPPQKESTALFLDIKIASEIDLDAIISFPFNGTYQPVIGFFNETSNTWEFPTSGLSINTTENLVSQTTTHFSTWGLYGEPTNPNNCTTVSISWILLLLLAFTLAFIL